MSTLKSLVVILGCMAAVLTVRAEDPGATIGSPGKSNASVRPSSDPSKLPDVTATGTVSETTKVERTGTGEKKVTVYILTTADGKKYVLQNVQGGEDLSVFAGKNVTVVGKELATSAALYIRISQISEVEKK